MKILVRSLERTVTEAELLKLFQDFGTVESCKLVLDPTTGKSKGFAFVEMEEASAGNAAIEALNGKETDGRTLRVNEAKPKEDRPRDSRPRRNF